MTNIDQPDLTFTLSTSAPSDLWSWQQCDAAAGRLSSILRSRLGAVDFVIGVPNGGTIVAELLADRIPGAAVLSVGVLASGGVGVWAVRDGIRENYGDLTGAHVALVDEVADSGRTLRHFVGELEQWGVQDIAVGALLCSKKCHEQGFLSAAVKDPLPNVVLPWRVGRDFAATAAAFVNNGELEESKLLKFLIQSGYCSDSADLAVLLSGLASSGRFRRQDDRWFEVIR